MDFLRHTLHVSDLPEQQTRIPPNLDEINVNLGHDACATCGQALTEVVQCPHCLRTHYCSQACRHQDTQPSDEALGHSAILCTLLKLCAQDDAVEEGIENFSKEQIQASQDRIQSELESYPATLANVLLEGPCYAALPDALVIHVVGASVEAELWNNNEDWQKAYAEALSELVERRSSVQVVFCGPECPSNDVHVTMGALTLRTIRGTYSPEMLVELGPPSVVVFFNPGLTVPDYDWSETLTCIPEGTPFLLTTNTELEGIADCQYLLDANCIQSVPVGLAEILGLLEGDDEPVETTAFFSENPFCGNRIRQSGTMANDLYVKNRWMLGGVWGKLDALQGAQTQKRARTNPDNAAFLI